MPEYRRNLVAGGTFFFTVNLADRRADTLVRHIDALRGAVAAARASRRFEIDAWVVLPDHMHSIWTLPPDDADYPSRWRAIKTALSKALPRTEDRTAAMLRRGERGIWQHRYWEHTIRDDRDFAAHMDYTHFNPVKHGYASHPSDWPYSSFHRCLAAGFYPADWSGGANEPEETGERR